MKRVFIMVLDSFGIGATSDADRFGDVGSDTLGHITTACAQGEADDGRTGTLYLPHLSCLGLGKAAEGSSGRFPIGLDKNAKMIGAYGYASEISSGKDTSSGHWEIAGVPVLFEWEYFTEKQNSFPKTLLNQLVKKANLSYFLGNCYSSGTVILDKLGEEHMKTGQPIVYTSSDSVFQIACHEDVFGLNNLYKLCEIARNTFDNSDYNIGRVIARPFIGTKSGYFHRTGNRRDYSVAPPAPTILKKLVEEKEGVVVAIGKIADIYANVGITKKIKSVGIEALFNATLEEIKRAEDNTIVLTNFVDFDSLYGHRRDVSGYAAALEFFDRRLPEMLELMQKNDILIITADHGCDPTWKGTDHTRENIPILMYGLNVNPGPLGHRKTFSDIGQTVAQYFNLSPMSYGKTLFES